MLKYLLLSFILVVSNIYPKDLDPKNNPLDRTYDLGLWAFNNGYYEDSFIILDYLVGESDNYPIAYIVLGRICTRPAEAHFNVGKAEWYFIQALILSGNDPKNEKEIIRAYKIFMRQLKGGKRNL